MVGKVVLFCEEGSTELDGGCVVGEIIVFLLAKRGEERCVPLDFTGREGEANKFTGGKVSGDKISLERLVLGGVLNFDLVPADVSIGVTPSS